METQKIVNLLNETDNEFPTFATRKWYVINDQNRTNYGDKNGNDESINFETKVIKSSLCDYSEAYILVTGDITAKNGDKNTNAEFKNCAQFTKCITHIHDEHIDTTESLDIIMPKYNLTEYSDNYSETFGSLLYFKRDESPISENENPVNVAVNNSSSFK